MNLSVLAESAEGQIILRSLGIARAFGFDHDLTEMIVTEVEARVEKMTLAVESTIPIKEAA